MSVLEEIRAHKKALEKIGHTYGARNIRVFGSVARGEAQPTSDVDLLVTFDRTRSGFDLGGFQYYATKLLGRHVDVVMDHHMHTALQEHILRDATPL